MNRYPGIEPAGIVRLKADIGDLEREREERVAAGLDVRTLDLLLGSKRRTLTLLLRVASDLGRTPAA